ncbi:filamentous hemagglutinin N-terminal domain-containing protein [Mannheimia haemolytica]|uniref:two-partner secretion domain-containing protein n=1 Tax=Mannheimia haemolytica TaxID=75985 RepID=UPI0001BCF80E|nr:filamentous hemagglutinin N-terminal domain-containing protein [Mannheimia haemolytica]EEY12799.1 heme-hemopexin utilization protein A [Mannheimia haemolytica serotype A2 str. BOVINE]MDW0722711.1 filamentous hemagglutinin N-terminal domain-containing protein [Mannheimia haemolytica]MDW0735577.1 filamentous hemagglutinin N-terminal domain-containing protein [Mannheimia haemolytica]TRC12038.1 filamentous hemagglutinin N-terminal domain-containing protein [Mannheimia haemolytica]TRC65841.1 fil
MFKRNAISLCILTACSGLAYANTADLPQGERVRVGTATIERTTDKMTVNQSSNKVQIDWNSFDIGKNKEVEFKQPTEMAVAYNRVTGGNASQIQGKLTANGKVYLANPNGVLITKDAEVNVGGLLVTTKDLEKISENGTKDKFSRKLAKEGKILNQGKITAKGERAFVVLVGDDVANEGEINAKNYYHKETKKVTECYDDSWSLVKQCYDFDKEIVKSTSGEVHLSSGENVTFTLSDRYIDVALDDNTVNSIIKNDGAIIANGDITLTAKGRNQALDSLIINNGVLQANKVQNKNGTIILSAGETQLHEKSQIKGEKVSFAEASYYGPTEDIKVVSKTGSKVTAPVIDFKGKTVNIQGEFGREDSTDLYNDELQILKTTVNIEVPNTEDIRIADTDNGGSGSFIQAGALASLLANNGRVNVQGKGFDVSGKLNVNAFKQTDSVLKFINQAGINIHNADIHANGRLFFVTNLPNDTDFQSNIRITDSKINLGNGSMGFGRSSKRWEMHDVVRRADTELRKKFNLDMKNVELNQVDDFVVAGGFQQVNLDNVKARGKTNFYLDSGNSRMFVGEQIYEYGVTDIEKRTQLANLDQRRKRWNSDNYDETDLNWEYNQRFDGFAAKHNHRAPIADTEINIANSDISLDNGFVHLMAEKINLDDSKINITFNQDNSLDESTQINRLGLNGKVSMKNSHINVVGDEKDGISPARHYATMFLVGELLGEKSSIFLKSHQGAVLRTDSNVKIAGKNSKDNLKITAITTGKKMGNEIIGPDGLPTSEDNDANASNTAFAIGYEPNATAIVENASITALAPNGGLAYTGTSKTQIDAKDNATFTFFEKPRAGYDKLLGDIKGNPDKLTPREFARLYDNIKGIKASSLSEQQLGLADTAKKTSEHTLANSLDVENLVSVTVCDEQNKCEERMLGNKNTNAKVIVGDIKFE